MSARTRLLQCPAEKWTAVAISLAVKVGGESEWCNQLQGGVSNPFWGFTQAMEVRMGDGGDGGALSKQRPKAATVGWCSGQIGRGWSTGVRRGSQKGGGMGRGVPSLFGLVSRGGCGGVVSSVRFRRGGGMLGEEVREVRRWC